MALPQLTRNECENEMKEAFGFVPKFYSEMPDVGYIASWILFRDLELSQQTALDNKTKELIGLAMAGHIKCPYCTYFHTEAAKAFGATPQEIREAIQMGGMTVLFSNNLNGTDHDYDEFKGEVDKALQHMKQKAQGAQV